MHHYVYISYHNPSKQYYIGGHSTDKNPHLDKYMGSGAAFNKLYKQDRSVWDKYILNEHPNVEEMRAAEYEAIKGHIGNGLCLNTKLIASTGSYSCKWKPADKAALAKVRKEIMHKRYEDPEERKRVGDNMRKRFEKPGEHAKFCTLLNKPLVCPHCGKNGIGSVMHRWHFDNCKHKINRT